MNDHHILIQKLTEAKLVAGYGSYDNFNSGLDKAIEIIQQTEEYPDNSPENTVIRWCIVELFKYKHPFDQVKAVIECYKQRTAELGMVSLDKCALAYCQADEAFDMNTYREKKPHPRGIEMAKAVLDAAGVKYDQ